MKKKMLAFFLALAVVLSLMPLSAFSAETENPEQSACEPAEEPETDLTDEPEEAAQDPQEEPAADFAAEPEEIPVDDDEEAQCDAVDGLAALWFTDCGSIDGEEYEMTPAFDPEVKEYTVQVPDAKDGFYVWATLDAALSDTAVIAYTRLYDDAEETREIPSGADYGEELSDILEDEAGSTAVITVTDGDYVDEYIINIVRTEPTLERLSLDSGELDQPFSPFVTEYSASTSAESVTVNAAAHNDSCTVTINGGSGNEVALEPGENVIEVTVLFAGGEENTYTVRIFRTVKAEMTLSVLDAMALFNAITSGQDVDPSAADVNGDGVVDELDVMAIYAAVRSGS